MKVSLNWVKQFISLDMPVDDLVEKIGSQLGAVEEVINLGERYAGILVAKVVSAEKHPNADKLKVCWIHDGGAVKGVPRNEQGHVHVVCGAPNVAAGQLVAWLPPGSTVPSTFEKDPFVLEAREIRGELSNGMIGSAKELALGDDHTGILVLDGQFTPGMPLAEALDLDDYVIDIENKMFTHRPDLFGELGIARELAGINGQAFKSPDWYREDAALDNDGRKNVLKLSVDNEVPALVPRFCAITVKDIKVGESPAWLKVRLSAVGIRPINNIVDVTNFYMMETGQPLHAYDYDKVKSGVLGARSSKKGEKLNLLNGKELILNDGAVVITDGERPIGLAGVMGGADTEVDENTKNIILECATFEMNRTRRTAMEYGIFTDAATRFTKNQSPRQNRAVIIKALEDILRVAGGRTASPLVDDKHFEEKPSAVEITPEFINTRLGLDLSGGDIKTLLENVEFKVEGEDKLKITVPFWRTDIEIPEDIVEEVGRLYGYDKLPVALPERDLAPAERNQMTDFKDRLRDILRRAGANEVLTYSFVHESLLKKTGQDPKKAYHIKNALSPDLQYYRLSLTPSLIDKIHPNIRAGYDRFVIFEIGKSHYKGEMDEDEPEVPNEDDHIALVLTRSGKQLEAGAPYYMARKYLSQIIDLESVSMCALAEFDLSTDEWGKQLTAPYEPQRAAVILKDEQIWGVVGELRNSVRQAFKLPEHTAAFEVHLDVVKIPQADYKPLNKFPVLEQDFNLRSKVDLSYARLTDFLKSNLDELCNDDGYEFAITPLDIYQKEDDKDHKQTTWRIILWHPERTLTTQETNKLLDELAERAKKELKAERV